MSFYVLYDEEGKMTDIFHATAVTKYEKKQQDWCVSGLKKLTGTQPKDRSQVQKLVDEVKKIMEEDEKQILVGTAIQGLPFQMLYRDGVILCEAEEITPVLFEQLEEDFVSNEEIEEVIKPYPIETEEPGVFFLNFKEASKKYPELSSKQMLLGFFKEKAFISIILICEHAFPWLLSMVEEKNWMMEQKNENGEVHLIISHETCKRNSIMTSIGMLMPKSKEFDQRTRDRDAVTYDNEGNIKSIYLEGFHMIDTQIGKLPAEMITFYSTGSPNRIFPSFGKISGYWSEEDEKKITPVSEFDLNGEKRRLKISCFCFYETGNKKSITLFPGEILLQEIGETKIHIRYGIKFREDGSIEAVEPSGRDRIELNGHLFQPFDPDANGITGDQGSMKFSKDGSICEFVTVVDEIIYKKDDSILTWKAMKVQDEMNPEKLRLLPFKVNPLKEGFLLQDTTGRNAFIRFDEILEVKESKEDNSCYMGCSSCSGCGN